MIRLLVFFTLLISIPHINNAFWGIADYLFYGSLMAVVLFCVFHGKGLKVTFIFIPFLLTIPLSLYVNDVPSIFKAPARAVAFMAVILAVGPFLQNNSFVLYRKELFIYMLALLRWIVLGSFVGYLLGLRLVYNWSGFCGLTYHSMLIGPIAGIVTLNYLYWIYSSTKEKEKWLNGLKMILSLFIVILAGSRAAFGACLLGIVFFILVLYKGRVTKILGLSLLSLILLGSTITFWWPYTERLQQKMEYSEVSGSMTTTRDALWTDRLNEFYHYPIFGVGFASYNLDIITDDKFDKSSGTIEPGSSWLFLLSSMGLMGFIFFLFPIGFMLKGVYFQKENVLKNTFLGAILVFFVGHMFFEGYVMASGAFLCFFLWLLFSECYLCLIKK